MRKIREKLNIFMAKSPQKAVLAGIMIFNIFFIMISAAILSILSQNISGLKECGFWEAVYHTILMVLDAGCVESVIADVGKAGVFAALVCIGVVVLGMMFFTGAVIGYITNGISNFIESKNNGKNRLIISDHVVIINWNSRGAEIINDFLYEKKDVKVVVLVPSDREAVNEEIRNRLDTTLIREAKHVLEATGGMSFFARKKYLRENLLKDKITVIVREGDVAAATDLDDICISKAKTVIILDGDERSAETEVKGNIQTIKTLIQVSEISKANSEQRILVEVTDNWTEDLIYRIIEFKSNEAKETIIPISSSRVLGKTHSHIAIMPELSDVYNNFFSGKGAHFISQEVSGEYSRENENVFIEKRFAENGTSIPLTVMDTMKGRRAFYLVSGESDLDENKPQPPVNIKVSLKKNCVSKKKCILVFGHNSNMDYLMEGFDLFRKEAERKGTGAMFSVVMVDSEENLGRHNYYRGYPNVETFAADVYDDEIINKEVLDSYVDSFEETTVLVLSDDSVRKEEADAEVLTYLIYIQEELRRSEKEDASFDRNKMRVVVEVLNPKNVDVVKSYGADKVIISNRYLSRVMARISQGTAIAEFYADILSYGSDGITDNGKEVLIRTAADFFEEIPGKCTANELIRSVFAEGDEKDKTLILGYITNKNDYVYFDGDQRNIEVELKPEDRLIVLGNHSA